MSLTKDRILNMAIKLFNKKGFVNVTMRDLAGELKMSLGNLTYHFKKKDDLMESIHNRIIAERTALMDSVQLIPSIVNIHNQLVPLLRLYERYRFFYQDTMEIVRAYPHIAKVHREHINSQIRYIKAVIDYSVGSGNMRPEARHGQYEQLAESVWMQLTFWLPQREVRNQQGNYYNQARSAMWNLVIPILSQKGLENLNMIDLNEEIQIQ